jgi:Zn finger protein HypA/HybF involved in hydrogenase expression
MNKLEVKDGQFYVQCCQCRQYRLEDGSYAHVEDVDETVKVSHTYCPVCYADMVATIKASK